MPIGLSVRDAKKITNDAKTDVYKRQGMDYEAWRRYLVFSVISALVPNLLLLLLVLRTISRPLQRITLAAVDVSKGAYGTEVDLRNSNDEIGLLAASFNEMSRKMASDIDELNSLNEQLIRAEKLAAMGTLAAGVAHEVNNPLASISSLVQMMRAQEGHSVETRERLNLVSAQIERIKQVTQDMTNFARTRPAAKADVNINSIIRTALRLASFDKSFQELEVETLLDNDLPKVFADEDQLQQVFLNLFLNARDAVSERLAVSSQQSDPPNSTNSTNSTNSINSIDLSIRTSTTATHVSIEIADTGVGIDAVAAGQIFDPFYTTKPAGQGTGLGLAVCYGIVTAHGGRIEVSPNQPNGTRFSIFLPVEP